MAVETLIRLGANINAINNVSLPNLIYMNDICTSNIYLIISYVHPKQKQPGCKKVQDQSEAALHQVLSDQTL